MTLVCATGRERGVRPMPKSAGVCIQCSKPIQPGTGKTLKTREAVHARCLVRLTILHAMNVRERATDVKGKADVAVEWARQLVTESRRLRTCPICLTPLSAGRSLLFQGDLLVHASCWQENRSDEPSPPPDGC
jgi:hypothetical protein